MKKNENLPAGGGKMNISHKILLEPVITEAATVASEMNKYVFKVSKGSTKKEIKTSIKEVYDVEAKKINVVNLPTKARNRGRIPGLKSGYRKAIVTLKEGDKIDVFGE